MTPGKYAQTMRLLKPDPLVRRFVVGIGGRRGLWVLRPRSSAVAALSSLESPCTDPLADAMTVLEHVRIGDPSARTDTEDAQNRVNLALEYLRMERERRAEPKRKQPLSAITDLLREGPTS